MPHSTELAEAVLSAFPGMIELSVPLHKVSRWRIGGTADIVARPRSIDELSRLRAWLNKRGVASVVVGSTSNLLFADAGLRAVCIQIERILDTITTRDGAMTIGAGAWVPMVARTAMRHGLSGIEHICGIPGTFGGLICMNGGSQRKGIGDHVTRVTSVSAGGAIIDRDGDECRFDYRTSVFQTTDEVVVSGSLLLEQRRSTSLIREEMLRIMGDRRRKFPKNLPNCGSVFVSNPAMYEKYGPPGALVERLGLRGHRIGGAQISPLHGNFIVNNGGATASDVLALIELARNRVREETGHTLAVEIRYVSPDGQIVPAQMPSTS